MTTFTKAHGWRAGLLVLSLAVPTAWATSIQLYETGPAEDAAFVRFVNGSEQATEVSAKGSQKRIKLDAAQPVSDFMAVRGGTRMEGEWANTSQPQAIDLTVQPGEFASVVGVPSKQGLTTVVVREEPDDFNAAKVSIGFYNLDGTCKEAGLLAAPRNLALFNNVELGQAARRQVNPVALSVRATCAGQPQEPVVDLGTLQAGERYSVFLLPSAHGPRLLHTTDRIGH